MDNLPMLSPEGMTIANAYLELQNMESVSLRLSISVDEVHKTLNTQHIRHYMDDVFNESGYMNKRKISATLDTLIDAKLLEMEESELTSRKDPADLLKLAHDMRVQELKLQIELKKLELTHSTNLAKLDQNDSLTDRRIEAAENRYKLRLQHEDTVKSQQLEAYNVLLEKLMDTKPKEVVIIDQTEY